MPWRFGVDDAALGQRVVLVATSAGGLAFRWRLRPCVMQRSELPLYMVPVRWSIVRDGAAPIPERQVRPQRSSASEVARMNIRPSTSPRSASPTASSRSAESRSSGLAERVGSTPFFAYDRALLTARVALLALDALRRHRAELRRESEPHAGGRPAPVGLGRLVRRRVAVEMRTALDTTMPADARQLRRPGQDPGRALAGGRGRGHRRAGIADGGSARRRGRRRARHRDRVSPSGVNPDFRVKGSGMRMGGGPQQFGIDAEQVPALLADLAARTWTLARLPRLRRVAEPERRGHRRGAAANRRPRARARAAAARRRSAT